jgi:dsRNA-specific ribonuclease
LIPVAGPAAPSLSVTQPDSIHSLEDEFGYRFNNPLLLAEALTHPSLAYETHRAHFDNQRLEFLGDAVLQLIFTHELFRTFGDYNEGNLTKLRARLVSRTALASATVKALVRERLEHPPSPIRNNPVKGTANEQ